MPAYVGAVQREERTVVTCNSRIIEHPSPRGMHLEARTESQQYEQRYRGGVEADVQITAAAVAADDAGVLARIRRAVRAARPPEALLWSIPA